MVEGERRGGRDEGGGVKKRGEYGSMEEQATETFDYEERSFGEFACSLRKFSDLKNMLMDCSILSMEQTLLTCNT